MLNSYSLVYKFNIIMAATIKTHNSLDNILDGVILNVNKCLKTFSLFIVINRCL
jgi:hypothetical protein